jgi:hypothetical protein
MEPQSRIKAEQEAALEYTLRLLDAQEGHQGRRAEAATSLSVTLGNWHTSEFLRNVLAARPLSATQSRELPAAIVGVNGLIGASLSCRAAHSSSGAAWLPMAP